MKFKKIFWPIFWTIFVIIFITIAISVPYYIYKTVSSGQVSVSFDESSNSKIKSMIPEISKANMEDINGILFGNIVWEGEITITGDTIIPPGATLNIKPGTTITFKANQDNNPSEYDQEVGPDGFNDLDPSRLKSYADTHSAIFIAGDIIAKGTKEQPIIFTSDAKNKHYADWVAINLAGGDALIENAIIEYSRNGIAVSVPNENIIVRDSIIRYAMWGCFSIKNSKGLYENNIAIACGHEGFDVGNDARIFNNTVKDSHSSIVVLSGSPILKGNTFQDDINQFDGATPIYEDNIVNHSLRCDKDKIWDYENFRIPCEGDPYLK